MKGLLQVDGSTIWEDGSKTYPLSLGKAKDPAWTWPYPPPAGGTPVDVPDASQSGAQYNPGPLPPTVQTPAPYPAGRGATSSPLTPIAVILVQAVPDLPASPTSDDVWNRWQAIVSEWRCMADWAGGIDNLSAAVGGNMKLYPKGNDAKTAIEWWKFIQSQGYDKAQGLADLTKGIGIAAFFGVGPLIQQVNEIAQLAHLHGYGGCPAPAPVPSSATPAPPPPATPLPAPPAPAGPVQEQGALDRAQGWWAGLSPRGKAVTGLGLLVGVGLLASAGSKTR